MKHLLSYFFILTVAFAALSCKDLNKLVSFNLDTNDRFVFHPLPDTLVTDTIPGNEQVFMVSDDYLFSRYEKFATNKSTPSGVEKVESSYFIVTIDSGAADFTFARDLVFYISSPNGLYEDLELGRISYPETGVSSVSLTLPVASAEWLNIIRRDGYRFRADFTFTGGMPDPVVLRLKMNFRLKAMPEGE